MEWVLVIVFALSGGGYTVQHEPVESRESCAEYARIAYTALDTQQRMVVAVGCHKAKWTGS